MRKGRPTAASGSATACSSAATRSCRARTATSSSRDGANIGFNCEMFSASRVTIGKDVLMAAYSYVIGGDHDFSGSVGSRCSSRSRTSAGVTIGDGAWMGAGAKILDGVTIGDHAVIGAGAVVRDNVAGARHRRRRSGARRLVCTAGMRRRSSRSTHAAETCSRIVALRVSLTCRVESVHGVSKRARGAPGEEDDQGDRRLPDDRGRRPRHGRAVGRQGQLGAAADSRRAAAARADPLLARRGQRRLRLQGVQARPDRQDLRGARLGVPDRAHRHRRAHRGHPRRRPDAVLALRAAAPRRAVPGGRRRSARRRSRSAITPTTSSKRCCSTSSSPAR